MNEQHWFFEWLISPVTLISLTLCIWIAFAFGKAYKKTGRSIYNKHKSVYIFITVLPISFIKIFIFALLIKSSSKSYFEYRNFSSIMLFRDPDNVQLPPEIGIHPEKGLFVPHATPSLSAQDSQTRKILSILIGIALIFVAYVVLIY